MDARCMRSVCEKAPCKVVDLRNLYEDFHLTDRVTLREMPISPYATVASRAKLINPFFSSSWGTPMITRRRLSSKELAPTLLLVLQLLVIITLPSPVVARVTYDNTVTAGREGYNPFGWQLTGVYLRVVYAYNWSSRSFLGVPFTYTEHWTYKAWWCGTCYAEIRYTYSSMDSSHIYTYALWRHGSWNGGEQGFTVIECKTTDTPGPGYVWHRVRVYAQGYVTIDIGDIIIQIVPVIIRFIIK